MLGKFVHCKNFLDFLLLSHILSIEKNVEKLSNIVPHTETEKELDMAQEKTEKPENKPNNVAPLKPMESKPAETAETTEKKSTEAKKPAAKTAKKKAAPKKKAAAKKATPKKVTAKKVATKKTTAKKPAVKKSSVKKKTAQKSAARAVKSATPKMKTPLSGATNPTMEKIMTQSKNQYDKLTKDATNMGRENVEAAIKSSTIFAKGCEDLMRMTMSIAQDAAERQSKFVKEALSSKTLNEWTEVQNKIAQANFDDFMSSATKITEMGVKIFNDSIEPINSQLSKSIKKASDSMAA